MAFLHTPTLTLLWLEICINRVHIWYTVVLPWNAKKKNKKKIPLRFICFTWWRVTLDKVLLWTASNDALKNQNFQVPIEKNVQFVTFCMPDQPQFQNSIWPTHSWNMMLNCISVIQSHTCCYMCRLQRNPLLLLLNVVILVTEHSDWFSHWNTVKLGLASFPDPSCDCWDK